MPSILNKYNSLGGASGPLGKPLGAETPCPDGIGAFQHFQNNASIYWSPSTGAHVVGGLIRKKWASLGWEKGFLGYPVTDELDTPAGGRFNGFQHGGTIIWKSGAAEAFEVHGAIRDKWGEFQFENGSLGFPTSDETATPDGKGRFNHFEKGSIYWKQSIAAHAVYGPIHGLWSSLGWEKNPALGYPISDVLKVGVTTYTDFENGVIAIFSNNEPDVFGKTTFPDPNGGSLNKTKEEICGSICSMVNKKISDSIGTISSDLHITDGPKCTDITDYVVDGNAVQNRNYVIYTKLMVDVFFFSDPVVEITLNIQIFHDKATASIISTLTAFSTHIDIPAPSSFFASAQEVKQKLHDILEPLRWKPLATRALPQIMENNLLSVKVMPNGDLNFFTALSHS